MIQVVKINTIKSKDVKLFSPDKEYFFIELGYGHQVNKIILKYPRHFKLNTL